MAGRKNRHKLNQFVDKYIAYNGDATKAMKEVNPHIDNNYVINNKVYRWLRDDSVVSMIANRLKELNIGTEDIKELIKARLIKIIIGDKSHDSDAINASNSIAKLLMLVKDKNIQINTNIINEDVLEKIKNRRIDTNIP